jgi:hypothetical protein
LPLRIFFLQVLPRSPQHQRLNILLLLVAVAVVQFAVVAVALEDIEQQQDFLLLREQVIP